MLTSFQVVQVMRILDAGIRPLITANTPETRRTAAHFIELLENKREQVVFAFIDEQLERPGFGELKTAPLMIRAYYALYRKYVGELKRG